MRDATGQGNYGVRILRPDYGAVQAEHPDKVARHPKCYLVCHTAAAIAEIGTSAEKYSASERHSDALKKSMGPRASSGR